MHERSQSNKPHVLLITRDPDLSRSAGDLFASREASVDIANSSGEADEMLRWHDVDAIFVDLDSENLHVEPRLLCKQLCSKWPELPLVVCSADGRMETALGAIRAGAYDLVRRPLSRHSVGEALDRVLRRRRLHRHVDAFSTSGEAPPPRGFIGNSQVMQSVYSLIHRVARSDVLVLIAGESGTGKEMVARAIHESSARAREPMIAVNCGAITATLLESELFGHVKGAFTDAESTREGLFCRAGGGTVFLDEIGDMPMDLQVKLLRVLQERTVRPVGSDAEVPYYARVIAATHQSLRERVAERTFREDLYYRLNVVSVNVPALRDRGNDVVMLAEHFRDRIARETGKRVEGFAASAIRCLYQYAWPGNVRELENAVERAVTLARGEIIQASDLPPALRKTSSLQDPTTLSRLDALPTLSDVQLSHIRRVLSWADGNKTKASSVLGIDRRTIYRRLKGAERVAKGVE